MQYVVKYQTIRESTLVDFNQKVNDMINQGWQPHAGVTITTNVVDMTSFAQAMVKYQPTNPSNMGAVECGS